MSDQQKTLPSKPVSNVAEPTEPTSPGPEQPAVSQPEAGQAQTTPAMETPAPSPVPPEPTHAVPPAYQPPQPTAPVSPPPPSVSAVMTTPGESASEFQNRVIQSEQVKEVKQARRTYKLENAAGVLLGSIEASLAIRLAFKLLGAKANNAFVNFLYQFTGVFANPFEGIFGANPMFGNFELDVGAIIGMIIYGVIGFGALKLVKLF